METITFTATLIALTVFLVTFVRFLIDPTVARGAIMTGTALAAVTLCTIGILTWG